MNAQKIILPTISVGLLITARQATASVVDFGLIAESLTVAATFFGSTIAGSTLAGNTIGGFTLTGLQFVGSHLNDVINGLTLTSILTTDLGPQNNGTATFNVPGNQGASGTLTFDGRYAVVNGGVTLTSNPVNGTLASCTPATSPGLPGCLTINAHVPINAYDPAGFITNLETAQILALPFGLSNGVTVTSNSTATIPLGSFNGVDFQGEEILTVVNTSAAEIPEPASWSFAALGAAMLGWWGRRRSRRK